MSADRDAWLAAGFSVAARESFREWNIALPLAVRWRAAGVPDGLIATRWSIAGAAPEQVKDWQGKGFDALEALQWRQLGHDLHSAVREKAAGRSPQPKPAGVQVGLGGFRGRNGEEPGPAFRGWLDGGGPRTRVTHEYLRAGWISDDALPWLQAEVGPESARTWLVLGVRPREAAAYEKQGLRPDDVVRDWWSAGVPLDQVADWLGAGFSPAEAQAHIAAGVDAERAAVLRALRDGTGD